jgi:hypothetical protein
VVVGPNATGIVVAVLGPAVNEATALAIPLPIFVPRPATSLIIAKFDHHAAVSETSAVPWAPTCKLERRASGYRDESRAVVLRAASASPWWPRLMCSLTYWRDVVVSFLILVLVVRACGNRNSVALLPLVLGVPANKMLRSLCLIIRLCARAESSRFPTCLLCCSWCSSSRASSWSAS